MAIRRTGRDRDFGWFGPDGEDTLPDSGSSPFLN